MTTSLAGALVQKGSTFQLSQISLQNLALDPFSSSRCLRAQQLSGWRFDCVVSSLRISSFVCAPMAIIWTHGTNPLPQSAPSLAEFYKCFMECPFTMLHSYMTAFNRMKSHEHIRLVPGAAWHTPVGLQIHRSSRELENEFRGNLTRTTIRLVLVERRHQLRMQQHPHCSHY